MYNWNGKIFNLHINNKQTLDFVSFIIITIVFVALVSSYVIVKIIKSKRKSE